MRDIRADLRERLEASEAATAKLEAAIAAEKARAQTIRELLEVEDVEFQATRGQQHVLTLATKPAPSESLDDYLLKAIIRGVSEKEELRDAAKRAGYFVNSKMSPGRVVHAKLMNLERERKARREGTRFFAR